MRALHNICVRKPARERHQHLRVSEHDEHRQRQRTVEQERHQRPGNAGQQQRHRNAERHGTAHVQLPLTSQDRMA